MPEEARKSSVCSRDSNVDPGVAELAHEGFFGAQPPLNEMCFMGLMMEEKIFLKRLHI